MSTFRILPLLVLSATTVPVAFAQFVDTFDTVNPGWTTDRFEPAGWGVAMFDGDSRLKIDINASTADVNRGGPYGAPFYNTQGRQRAANIAGPWTVKGSVYLDEALLTGSTQFRTDLWARNDAPDESEATYPIFGISRMNPADPFGSNVDMLNRWRVFDAETGGWVVVRAPIVSGWNQLEIRGTGTSMTYFLNGNKV